MKICKSGRVIEKTYHKKQYFYIRLNLVDEDIKGRGSFSTKDIRTELLVNKRNMNKASALVETYVDKYNHQNSCDYFDEYLMKWLSSKKTLIESTTYEGYEYRAAVIIEYFSKSKLLISEIQPKDIKDFYSYLLTVEHGVGRRYSEGYSNRSIKDISAVLKSALKEAVNLKYITENPALNVTVPYRSTEQVVKPYVSTSELNAFFLAIKGHRLEIPFIFAIYYGLRRSEICGLRWSAIHKDGKLYIEHTVTRMKTTVAKNRCKTDASYRNYPIPRTIRQLLEITRYKQSYNRKSFGDDYYPSDYIFTWEDGRPYSPDYLTKSFKKIVRTNESLDSNLTLHSLRASCVSNMIHDGIDIKDVQTWVGHKDIQTTLNIYARTNERQQVAVADKMANRLFGAC